MERKEEEWHVVTDMDGVVADSEHVAMRVMDDWGLSFVRAHKANAALKQNDIYTNYPGTSTDKIVAALINTFTLPLENIISKYEELKKDQSLKEGPGSSQETIVSKVSTFLANLVTIETIECFKTKLKAVPNATKAFQEIRRLFKPENVGLATTSREDRMDVSLKHASDPDTGASAALDQLFPKGPLRFSGYDFENKYDEFLKRTGWSAAKTIVVEDSLSGVTKAKKGRPEINVIGTVAAEFYVDKEAQAAALIAAGATLVVLNMSDLPKAAQWIKDGCPDKKPDFDFPVFVPPQTLSRAQTLKPAPQ